MRCLLALLSVLFAAPVTATPIPTQFNLLLIEGSPEEGIAYHGQFAIGDKIPGSGGFYAITKFSATVGHCPTYDEWQQTYSLVEPWDCRITHPGDVVSWELMGFHPHKGLFDAFVEYRDEAIFSTGGDGHARLTLYADGGYSHFVFNGEGIVTSTGVYSVATLPEEVPEPPVLALLALIAGVTLRRCKIAGSHRAKSARYGEVMAMFNPNLSFSTAHARPGAFSKMPSS